MFLMFNCPYVVLHQFKVLHHIKRTYVIQTTCVFISSFVYAKLTLPMCTKLSSLSMTYFHCIAYSCIRTLSTLFSLQCLFICIDIVTPFSSRYAYPMSCAIITPHDIVSMNCTILMTLCPYVCANKIHHLHLTCV